MSVEPREMKHSKSRSVEPSLLTRPTHTDFRLTVVIRFVDVLIN